MIATEPKRRGRKPKWPARLLKMKIGGELQVKESERQYLFQILRDMAKGGAFFTSRKGEDGNATISRITRDEYRRLLISRGEKKFADSLALNTNEQ